MPMPKRGLIDAIPHATELLATLGHSRQALRDAQTEVLPFGAAYHACAAAAAAIDAFADLVTAQPADLDVLAMMAADIQSLDRPAV